MVGHKFTARKLSHGKVVEGAAEERSQNNSSVSDKGRGDFHLTYAKNDIASTPTSILCDLKQLSIFLDANQLNQ